MDALEDLAQRYSDPAQFIRIRMLQVLREDPSRTLTEVAELIDSSERTVQRWWGTYCSKGLEAMMEIKQRGGKKPKRIGDAELHALQQKVRTAPFIKLDEARIWLHREHGVNYSRSGLWYLMQKNQGQQQQEVAIEPSPAVTIDKPTPDPVRTSNPSAAAVAEAAARFPLHIIKFLNALPNSGDEKEWGPKFTRTLCEVLGDVDRISLSINTKCDLSNPTEYEPDTYISQFSLTAQNQNAAPVFSSEQSFASQRMLENMRRRGTFQFDQYREPVCFDYRLEGKANLGGLILWRESHKRPISDDTIETMRALEPFIIFMLSDMVARHQAQRPMDGAFYDAVAEMTEEAQLSKSEKRIVILRLMGHSYKDVADNLFVTVDTVKKHLTQIHRKTQTNGMAELFAKYFSARLIPRDFSD
jgi:DNA-binding CsgD family transcriptional regulator